MLLGSLISCSSKPTLRILFDREVFDAQSIPSSASIDDLHSHLYNLCPDINLHDIIYNFTSSVDEDYDINYKDYELKIKYRNNEDVEECFNASYFLGVPIEEIEIPEGVKQIAEYGFSRTSAKRIILPQTVLQIGSYAFSYASKLEKINLPIGINEIKECTFYKCKNLKEIELPLNLLRIGQTAFYGAGITNIDLPQSLLKIDASAFGKTNLEKVFIPKNTTDIDGNVFRDCENLVSIVVDDANLVYDSRNNCNAIISKEDDALIAGCNTTKIPEDILSIEYAAFSSCKFDYIDIPSNINTISHHAFASSNIKYIDIPPGMDELWLEAFAGCKNLESIDIAHGISTVAGGLLHCLNIKELDFPSSVIDLSIYIENCPRLQTLIFHSRRPCSFSSSLPKNITILVPYDCIDNYKNEDGWREYADQIIASEEQGFENTYDEP